MDLLWIKIASLVGLFVVIFLCTVAPLWMSRRKTRAVGEGQGSLVQLVTTLCNCFGGGVFLSVCFVGLTPHVREKFNQVLDAHSIPHYPVAELCIVLGYFLILLIEQLGQHCRQKRQKVRHSAYESLQSPKRSTPTSDTSDNEEEGVSLLPSSTPDSNATAEACTAPETLQLAGTDENHEHNSSRNSRCRRKRDHYIKDKGKDEGSHTTDHGGHSHSVDVAGQPLLKSAVLLIALGLHSLFEGMAMGLQEDTALYANLFISVLLHEILCAFAMGLSLCNSGTRVDGNGQAAPGINTGLVVKLSIVFSLMIPVGMVIGMVVTRVLQGEVGALISGTLQGVATGTLYYVVFAEVLPAALAGPRWPALKLLFLFIGSAVMAGVLVATDHPMVDEPCKMAPDEG